MAKILIIDDDPQVLKLLASFLERDGHEIAVAANGKQAIKLMGQGKVEIVITDLIMPDGDGFEVINWIDDRPERPKIVALTGGSAALKKDMLLSLASFAADRVLTKPVDYATLKNTVEGLLQPG